MQLRDSYQTLVTLANASELARVVAQGVIGNELADTLSGSPLTQQALYSLAQAKMQAQLSRYLGVN